VAVALSYRRWPRERDRRPLALPDDRDVVLGAGVGNDCIEGTDHILVAARRVAAELAPAAGAGYPVTPDVDVLGREVDAGRASNLYLAGVAVVLDDEVEFADALWRLDARGVRRRLASTPRAAGQRAGRGRRCESAHALQCAPA